MQYRMSRTGRQMQQGQAGAQKMLQWGELRQPTHIGVSTARGRGRGGPPSNACDPPTLRPLHIAVVHGNLPIVHRLVTLFQHVGRDLDIYNNLRQVRGSQDSGSWGMGGCILRLWVLGKDGLDLPRGGAFSSSASRVSRQVEWEEARITLGCRGRRRS